MANITSDIPLRFIGPVYAEKWPVSLEAAFSIWKGAPVIIDVSVDDDQVTTQEGVTMAATDINVGIAAERMVVLGTETVAPLLEVYTWPTIVGFPSTVFTNADLGAVVYMSDTGTLSGTTGTYSKIGTLFKVEHGYAYVLLDPPSVRGAVS